MNYPFWDAPLGYGILMAGIAVVHVFISHFAIGGGLYLVVTERAARARNDEATLAFLQTLSKFFARLTLVAGALTGVGIWFVIGLLAPVATEALIHNYVWGWATEWTFFLVEIAAALLYYYGWTRMSARAHLTIGWIYFGAAWLSLFIINGILTFMLTPGQWLASGSFWDGFFNPTFWPSLVLRTGVCLMLASLYALLVAARSEAGAFKTRTVRSLTTWGLAGLVVMVAAGFWYWYAIPGAIRTVAQQSMRMPMHALRASLGIAAALAALLVVCRAAAQRLPVVLAGLVLAVGFGWFGSFEMFREGMRKPYIITGYIYGNGIEVAQAQRYRTDGYLSHIAYRTGDDPADLFRHACRSCHTIDGYKPLRPAFDGTDPAFIAAIVRGAHLLKGHMPPFFGTATEADEIAAYLYGRVDQRPLEQICAERGEPLGATAYAVRCGKCHVAGTATDNSAAFAGQDAAALNGILDVAASLGEGMPAYTGPPAERAALVAYLQELGRQVKP
jgi:mono/diheme cytochrome c family protein/cytochrome bd-type quinol oxidase subunit 1